MEPSRLRHAALLLQHHRPADAERELRNHLATEPTDITALLLLSTALSIQDKDAEAVNVARQAVGLAPDLDTAQFHLGRALLGQGDLKGARHAAEEAVRLDPEDAENYGLLALTLHHAKEHTLALDAAERGLAVDPEHLGCLNVRSAELGYQKRFAEADSTIEKALLLDPENPYTHSNTGWAALRRGDHARAMEHFREALRREPGMENARRGMIEALKARYWLYRQWLKYVFWVGNLKPGMQYAFIIGIWLLIQLLRTVSDTSPLLALIAWPILIGYVLFALSTWLVTPLTNLLLRLNRFGRYVLSTEEKRTSTFTGIALGLFLAGGLGFLFTFWPPLIAVGLYGLLMMIPMASMDNPVDLDKRRIRQGIALLLAVVGLVGVVLAFAGQEPLNTPMKVFCYGAIAYQWIAVLLVR
ncbi:MAG TPA: tetratricopeptide repeat protein [Flavobacteriales bacterium]|jgi:Tfp pilus assembly protein PilF|nr:tetratricopeptide repeat protein [Flavobacteriales bacterium]